MRLLLLAGTGEARQIANALAKEPRVSAVASLAGQTRSPVALGLPTRIGGFGGRDAFGDYLGHEKIDAVLDATHPFAHQISHRTAEVCGDRGVPYLQFLRPPWMPGEGDDWTFLNAEEEAANHIATGAVVFLATGPQNLDRFAGLQGCRIYCRRIDPPRAPFPLPGGDWLVGRPPFSVEEEMALFHDLAVDWLVVKNSGGWASRSKLDAARDLGLKVAMIRRPPQPQAPKVSTVADALSWVRSLT
ncbi:MAG: cobalt-precorrin-6A reductase [Rhodobacter sp.]|nr:cobalt-precorrin-6A reductase [Rhodobacter sp.]